MDGGKQVGVRRQRPLNTHFDVEVVRFEWSIVCADKGLFPPNSHAEGLRANAPECDCIWRREAFKEVITLNGSY